MGNDPVNGTDPDGGYFISGARPSLNMQNTINKMNEQRVQDSKDEYWQKKSDFEKYHGDGYGGIDPAWTSAYLQLDATYSGVFDMGINSSENTFMDGSTMFNSILEGLDDMSANQDAMLAQNLTRTTTVDASLTLLGNTMQIAHGEFDGYADGINYANNILMDLLERN